MYLSQTCKPRQSVFDRSRRDVVLNISDLLENRIDGDRFFEENYITAGMETLINRAFGRLENISSQAGTFLLAQAMGGGKTHSMIALGLLAKYPELRAKVLGNKRTSDGAELGSAPVSSEVGSQVGIG